MGRRNNITRDLFIYFLAFGVQKTKVAQSRNQAYEAVQYFWKTYFGENLSLGAIRAAYEKGKKSAELLDPGKSPNESARVRQLISVFQEEVRRRTIQKFESAREEMARSDKAKQITDRQRPPHRAR
jgi:hypothetical protein